MSDGFTITAIVATFLLAGTVKGVIGLGLPTVSLALLTVTLGLTEAMAILLLPSFITNLWQALAGAYLQEILRRLWIFLLTATVSIGLGAMLLSRVDLIFLSALLGILLIVYAGGSLAGLQLRISKQQEAWLAPVMGLINGALTGMTGSFVVPGVLFLQALGLHRDMLIQAMGLLFTLSTLGLAIALQHNQLLTMELGVLSAAALIPALLGMIMGQWIRQRLAESLFRRVFFSALLMLGIYIVIGALLKN